MSNCFCKLNHSGQWIACNLNSSCRCTHFCFGLASFSSPEAALLLVSTKNHDLWPSPTPEVRDSRTSCHSAHAQSRVWQIWLVLVSIYCVYKAIQNRNVVGLSQRSWFLVLTKRSAASGDENGLASARVRPYCPFAFVFTDKHKCDSGRKDMLLVYICTIRSGDGLQTVFNLSCLRYFGFIRKT